MTSGTVGGCTVGFVTGHTGGHTDIGAPARIDLGGTAMALNARNARHPVQGVMKTYRRIQTGWTIVGMVTGCEQQAVGMRQGGRCGNRHAMAVQTSRTGGHIGTGTIQDTRMAIDAIDSQCIMQDMAKRQRTCGKWCGIGLSPSSQIGYEKPRQQGRAPDWCVSNQGRDKGHSGKL